MKLPSNTLQRRSLTVALLSAMAFPAFAGTNCQLLDNTGAPLPLDSNSPGVDSLACGPRAKA